MISFFIKKLVPVNMQYRWRWFKHDLKRLYYSFFYNMKMDGFDGTMLPNLGKGEFVSVYRRGDFIDIINEKSNKKQMVRLIPCQYNHGVMVEVWENGNLRSRSSCDINEFLKMGGCKRELCEK